MTESLLLALDQGTTSSRALVFDRDCRVRGLGQHELPQIYPSPGHVEHDPLQIWSTQRQAALDALASTPMSGREIAAIGVTNQRETTILWDRRTGAPVANAIVWQSRITADRCTQLKHDGCEPLVQARTGLRLDAYFSATKIQYLLDTVPGLRQRATAGEILFGTVDSYLIWQLTGGRVHVTDVSNASRTLLYNIHERCWDPELLRLFQVPESLLPRVVASSGIVGTTDPKLFGAEMPIAGIAGDQQAATFGQGCLQPGDAKNTYGTGCFLLMNTGDSAIASEQGLLTTIAWQLGDQLTYALEGSVFVAGAAVQWLRDELQLIGSAAEIEALAGTVPDNGGVYFVPAFVGLGTPYWDSDARGLIIGLTRGTQRGHIARATLESLAYQSRAVLEVMQRESGRRLPSLKVDGGATANNLLMQFQADVLGVSVRRPIVRETTALGAAALAGLAVGVWDSPEQFASHLELDREFEPTTSRQSAMQGYRCWQQAAERSLGWRPIAEPWV